VTPEAGASYIGILISAPTLKNWRQARNAHFSAPIQIIAAAAKHGQTTARCAAKIHLLVIRCFQQSRIENKKTRLR
jgi:hypothetical protein